jgi:hypothetical protein
MADLVAFFANFPSMGERFTKVDGRSTRNLIPMRLDDYEVELYQNPEIIRNFSKFKGAWCYSTRVVVRKVSQRKFSFVKEMLWDLADLLSFATTCRVEFFGYEYPKDSGKLRRWNSYGTPDPFWSLVDRIEGASTSDLVQQVWPRYRALKEPRRLSIVIRHLVEAARATGAGGPPLELRLLMDVVVLENLKNTFASSQGFPYAYGYFRKAGPGATNLRKARTYGFEELVNLMLREQKMRRGIRRIVKLRNELIHGGVVDRSFESAHRAHCSIMNLIREYLLRLLGYHGRYGNFGGQIRSI